jgi:hypothetical protein
MLNQQHFCFSFLVSFENVLLTLTLTGTIWAQAKASAFFNIPRDYQ